MKLLNLDFLLAYKINMTKMTFQPFSFNKKYIIDFIFGPTNAISALKANSRYPLADDLLVSVLAFAYFEY